MSKTGVIITGATGFLGKRLVRELRKSYRVFAIGRRTPREAGAPEGPGIHWLRLDISDFHRLQQAFCWVREMGGADLCLHLAAYYDFTGEDNPEYWRSNVIGTRNMLELSAPLKLKAFIFASSVAACPFPAPGDKVREDTPATAPIPYGRSKRAGEALVQEYRDRFPCCILRLAAIFSDWCEYEPLGEFLRTWCSHRWNSRILGGKGQSAIPYLHIRDLQSFFFRVIEQWDQLQSGEILQASPDGSTTHLELYREATRCFFGTPRRAIHVPKTLAHRGIFLRERLGSITGHMPFERPWMVDYIDLRLDIDASRTRRRIDWQPRADLHVLQRIPCVVENMVRRPDRWNALNKRREPGKTGQELDAGTWRSIRQ